MRMRSLSARVSVVALAAAMSVFTVAAPGHASSCNPSHDNWDTAAGKFFDGSSVNIRSGPHLTCGVLGQGQLSHYVRYECYTAFGDAVTRNGETLRTWTYLTDTANGVSGWVSDLYLTNRGSYSLC